MTDNRSLPEPPGDTPDPIPESLDLPPPYETIAARGTSLKHIYLTPGLPPEEESPPVYLEPNFAYHLPRESGVYSSIDEMGTFSDVDNNVYQGQSVVNPHWMRMSAPKPPSAPPFPPATNPPLPGKFRRDRRCLVCAIVAVAIVVLITLLAASIFGVLFFTGKKSVQAGPEIMVDLTASSTQRWTLGTDNPPRWMTTSPSPEHSYCSNNPCENGARCHEAGAAGFYCHCSWPFYGQRCENVNKEEACDVSTGQGGLAEPFFSTSGGYTTNHCTQCPTEGCAGEIHMIAMYEPEGGNRGFQQRPSLVPQVPVDVVSSRYNVSLTLVLSSYEATNWVITLPRGIRVAHVFLMSYYQSVSSVKVSYSDGTEIHDYELHPPTTAHYYMDHRGTGPRSTYPFGYGCSSCKGIDDVMTTMTSQYGCFASFSGRYVAKSWKLNIDNNDC